MLVAIGGVASANVRQGKGKVEKEIVPLKVGDRCPVFNFEDIHGKKVSLKKFRGQYVFIDIWATWCPPCRDELPYLRILEQNLKDKNICFVSISCDKDKQKWKNMVDKENLGGVQLYMGSDRDFMEAFGNRKIPRFVLVDPKGKIVSPKTSRPSEAETEPMLRALKGI